MQVLLGINGKDGKLGRMLDNEVGSARIGVITGLDAVQGIKRIANGSEEALEKVVKETGQTGRDIVGSTFDDIKPTQDVINSGKVTEYVEKLKTGQYVEPIEMFEVPGKGYYISEGHHRYVASQQTGLPVDIINREGGGPVGLPVWSKVIWREFINEAQFWD